MYYYYLYNFILKSEIRFDMLVENNPLGNDYNINDYSIIELYINKPLPKQSVYTVPFEEDITYYLYPEDNSIYVQAKDEQNIYNSLFNIPMSYYALLKNCVLLHCSGVEYNGSLMCFSGGKGMGKSTLAMALRKYANVFSDDSVCFDFDDQENKVYGYQASRIAKLCRDTYNMVNTEISFEDQYDPVSKKANVVVIDNVHKRSLAKKIFFMVRGANQGFECTLVNPNVTKKVLLTQSIVGKRYIPREIIDIFGKTQVFHKMIEKLEFYILKIPRMDDYEVLAGDFFEHCIK